MTFVQMCLFIGLFIFGLLFLDLLSSLFFGKDDTPRLNMECLSPLGETLCDNCVDLDQCDDDNCPYDWVDWGVE